MSIEHVAQVVETIADSSFVPQHFRDKQTGQVRIADLRYAVEWLRHKGLDPLQNIDQVYVVGGRVNAQAELQRTLVRRAGFDLEVVSADDEAATVRIRRLPVGPNMPQDAYPWREATVTMAEARRAKWPERNPSYGLMPSRMLVARACTRAISLYAPEASRLAGVSEEGDADIAGMEHDLAPPGQRDGREELLHTVRRDEPTVDPERVAHLKAQLLAMPAGEREELRRVCKELHMPNLEGPAFTLRDAALLHRLVMEVRRNAAVAAVLAEEDPERPFEDDDE